MSRHKKRDYPVVQTNWSIGQDLKHSMHIVAELLDKSASETQEIIVRSFMDDSDVSPKVVRQIKALLIIANNHYRKDNAP